MRRARALPAGRVRPSAATELPPGRSGTPGPETISASTFDTDSIGADVPADAAPDSTLPCHVPSLPPAAHGLPTVAIGREPRHALIEGERLGAGGMGVVHAATDTVLERTVAVKRPLVAAGPRAATALVAKARTLAGLDHPNVVPVHTLGCDLDGAPLLVMKRVVGRRWSDVVEHGRDLERDLEITLKVADALRFAHARGVLHRDVKPDNVMVGEFGEVYLMDWGCACAAADAVTWEIVGTPTCMAPEMVRVGARIGPATDVALLGATLFQVLTGTPRNVGANAREVLAHAWHGTPPVWPPEVPGDLRAIVDRACAHVMDTRYPTIDTFVADLRGFLGHRQAAVLAARSTAILFRLERACAASDPAADGLFAECRFGFRSALEAWPGCGEAGDGLDRAYAAFIPWKISIGELSAVDALLAEVSGPAAAGWAGAVARTRRDREVAAAELRAIDMRVAATERRNATVGMVATGTLGAVVVAFGKPPAEFDALDHLLLGTWTLAVLAGWMVPFRHHLLGHRASRAIMLGMVVSMAFVVLNRGIGWWAVTPVAITLRTDCMLGAVTAIVLAMSWEWTLALAAVPYLAGVVAMTLRPDLAGLFFPMALVAGGGVIAFLFVRTVRGRT